MTRQTQKDDEVAPVTFGTVLREARERKGYDLASAARRLRIRPDILRAIESSDFASMPPRGYTRNMVNAYARLVGLNPTEMTRMYLDEAYAYQVGRARSQVQRPTGFDMGGSSREARGERQRSHAPAPEAHEPRQNALGRTLYDDRRDYRTRSGEEPRLYSGNQTHPSRHTALPNAQYTNFYAGPKSTSVVRSKLPFIIAGVVVLVLLVVILVSVFSCRDSAQEEVPNVPISGLTDTTKQDGDTDDTQQPAPVEVAPTSAKVVYELASGKEAYVVITKDGEETEQMLTGPVEETVEVTGTWSLATWATDGFTVTVNGEAIEFDQTTEDGMPLCTVDFTAVLDQWKADHPNAAANSGANTADAANTTPSTTDAGDTPTA